MSDAPALPAPAGRSPLRIGFDRTACFVTRAGLARYVRGLERGLAEAGAPDLQFVPLAWQVENFGYAQPARALKTLYREVVWGKCIAPVLLRRAGASLLHSTSSLFIRFPRGIRHVVTLHDLSISRHPERFRSWQVAAWRRGIPGILDADRVICISRFTADEAIALLGLPAAKIDVVPNGCDWHDETIPFPETEPGFAVPSEFFLFVGTLEPGKNLRLLRETWRAAASEGRPLPALVIVGSRREGVATEGSAPADWHRLGRQPDGVLLHLYRRALALLFPSQYEGFGFPVVEAMAQGCPVVCSPVSSLPEVAGNAALMVPLDAASYLGAARELQASPGLRADLAAAGRQNARRFTWTRCATETIGVYRRALSG